MRKISIVITTAALALLACGGEEGVTGAKTPKADTPDACMNQLEETFASREVDRLKSQLAPDFVFYFNPLEVGTEVNGYVIPLSWNGDAFARVCHNIFWRAYGVGIAVNKIPEPPAGETTYVSNNIPVAFMVMENRNKGYSANGGFCDFTFEPYEKDGEALWRLTEWRDHTSASLGDAAPPSSLGSILAVYYY